MCGNRRSTAAWRGPARNLFRPSAEHEFSVNPFDGEKSNGVGHALLVNAENSRADVPAELEEHLRQAIDSVVDRIVGGWMWVS